MKRKLVWLLPAVWAIALLFSGLAPQAQQAEQKALPVGAPFLLLPGSPLDLLLALPGISPPLLYESSTAHTRPELANRQIPAGAPHLQEGKALGNEGVVEAGRFPLPFGTKGEKVALAFLGGEYVPPPGEKLQPALARLAQARAAQLSVQGSNARPAVYALLLLNGNLDEALQAWLEERGVQLFGFYPYSAYQARIPVDSLNAVASHPQVRWVGQPTPVQKVDPALLYFLGDQTGEKVSLYVNLFAADEEARAAISNMVTETGTYDPSLGVIAVVADAATVHRLLDMDAVLFVEPIRPATTMHAQSQASINADLLWHHQVDGRPVGGRATKVGVMDTGLSYHWDFFHIWNGAAGYNRTTETNVWDDVHGHGTHVTGTFLGAGVAQARYRGTASGLRDTDVDGWDLLVSKVFRRASDGRGVSEGNSMYEGLLDMQGRELRFRRQVFNLSGGSSGTNLVGTDAQSRKVDELFQLNIVPVISAGNDGPNGGTIGSPGVAKGAFTVGAIYDDYEGWVDNVTDYSSRGPTGDNRVKPDVVAPGSWITSCSHTSTNGYLADWSGTSMAAPHVAGVVAAHIAHFNLPAWATKSTIIANAINLGHASTAQGHGKVDGFQSYANIDGWWSTWWWGNGGTGDLRTIDFNLPQTASLLRIVLVYPDAPAPSGGSIALKNDLDLFLDRAPFTSGASGEWNSLSARDNVEVITVANAPAGDYRIKVHTYRQNEGSSQSWAVTVRAIYGSVNPNVTVVFETPVAVRPNVNFDVVGRARADSYVASGVLGDIDLLSSGITLNSTTYVRYAPNGTEESFDLGNIDRPLNQGSIPAGHWRRLVWNLRGTTEGSKSIRYDIASRNGGTAAVTRSVIVDGTPPASWQGFTPDWTNDPTPDCWIQVRDSLAGLNTGALYYWYWTSSTGVQGPFACTTSAANGSTTLEWIRAQGVPFNQEGGNWQNQIFFRAYDRAGNSSDSGWQNVKVDLTAPQDWQSFTVTSVGTTGLTPTCTVRVRDVLSGLATSALGWYRYSTNGGSTWSSWFIGAITGSDGTTVLQTITASEVPFNLQSASQNRIQFAVRDVAGNWSYSPQYIVATKHTTTLELEDVSGTIGQNVTLRATLRRVADGGQVGGRQVTFTVDGTNAGSANTNSSGVAIRSWTVSAGTLGNRPMSASFAGDAEYHATAVGATFRRYANTTVTVADASGRRGDTVPLSATLKQSHDGAPLPGRTLSFQVGTTTVGSATTNASGIAKVQYTIPASLSLGAHAVTVTFAGNDPLNASAGRGTLTVAANTRRVAGRVELQEFIGDPSTQSVTIEVRNPGSTSALETHVVTLDGGSQYSFDTALSGTFDVAAKGSHWLRQTHGNLSITTNITLNFSLVNGDVDGDNEVSLLDFGALLGAFGSTPGEEAWNPNADLDGDEEVSLLDFGILLRNFGAMGDD